MTNSKSTRRALLTSALAMLMCVAMLIGTTFAWFTDTASTAVNKIQSGKLDVALEMKNPDYGIVGKETMNQEWISAEGKTLEFKKAAGAPEDETVLWEPGCTYELPELRIVNNGNLALKYKVVITGIKGSAELNEAIEWTIGDVALGTEQHLLAGENAVFSIKGHMKDDAGNEYQGLSIDGIGITVVATQYTYEYDSNGKTYDNRADATIQVNPENIQDYLDGKYGTIDGATLVLAEGNYGKLELGRATKYAGSNTQYFNTDEGFNGTPVTLGDFVSSHANRYYIRSMSNVTFKPAEGATVSIAGIELMSGHATANAGNVMDYVLDTVMQNGESYYLAHRVYNIKFEGINFTAKCYILGDYDATVINGFTFENCKFNLTESNSQAIHYGYQSAVPFKVSNLVVNNCEFTNCHQGVYAKHVYGVTVNQCKFSTLGHNAIAIQDDEICDRGAVVITGNTFENIPKPVIRFGRVGSDTQITIKNNNATNCGEGRPENAAAYTSKMVIEASSLAAGVTYDISGNVWETDTEPYSLPRTFSHSEFNDR